MLNYYRLKCFSVFLFLILGILNAMAGPRDFLQVQQIAQQKAAALGASISSDDIQLARAKGLNVDTQQKTPPYYIFNFADHAGYAIVGGDDRMPAIVGYSDRGSLNTDSLPENLKSFLAAYKATVEAVEKGDSSAVKNVEAAMKRVAGSYTPVAPLLGGIVWGQDSPFNDLCPKYDGVHTAVTGCVATAMAQIMRYWKFPSSLIEDIPAYTSKEYNIPIDGIQNGIGYDWDNMLESYNGGCTSVQAIAVSTLMQHIGASVKMQYGPVSGAYSEDVVSALTQYFGYDKNVIKYLERDNFAWEDWNKILQDELSKKRPIYYAGSSNSGGHAFVCDGMDADGYYHINWGWDGMSNDYFDITILNPDKRGAGASASVNGYSNSNAAIIGIVPDDAQDKEPSFVYDKLFASQFRLDCTRERQSASDSFSGTANCTFTSLDQDRQVIVSVGIKDKNGNVVPISSERKSLYIQKDESQYIDIAFDYVLPVGEYEIYAIQSTDNGDTWECCYGKNRMVYVNDTELFFNILHEVMRDGIKYTVDIFHKEACAKSFSGDNVEVVIPSSVSYLDWKCVVTKIADKCFFGCSSLASVSLPNTLKIIGSDCFAGCSSLLEIEIPEGVTVIPQYCFWKCSSLTSVTLPNTLKAIGGSSFEECSNLLKIEIPKGVAELGIQCFAGCSSLLKIEIPKGVTELGESCFGGCSSLLEIEIPKGVTVIPRNCIAGCSSLASVSLPNTLKIIGSLCFWGCSSLLKIEIPEGVTELGESCFEDCSSLTSISLPTTLKTIGDWCFYQCSSLSQIDIPEGVTELGGNCFWYCSSLARVSLPGTLGDKLPEWCFKWCPALKSVVLSEGITMIPEYCFYGCSSLTSVSLPSTLRELGEGCFCSCSSWNEDVIIPEGVTVIRECCFQFCSSLRSISLPSTLRELGVGCFENCSSWKGDVVIPEGVTVIPENCFLSCVSLTSISLPSTLRELGEGCFEWCSSWKGDVVIPEGVTVIPDFCFAACKSLNSISLPSTIQKIGLDFLCNDFTDLKRIQIKSSKVLDDFKEAIIYASDHEHDIDFNSTTLYVPASSVEAYKQVVGQYFKEVLPLTETGINQPNLDGMTISANQGSIIISGLKDGTQVRFYAVDGKYIGESIASQGRVSFYCQEPMAIAKMGNKTLKIAVK